MHSDDPPADTRKTRRPGKMDGVRAVYIAERTHHLFEEQHLSEVAVGKRTQASSDSAPRDRGSSPKPKQPAACVCLCVSILLPGPNGSLIITWIIFASIQPSFHRGRWGSPATDVMQLDCATSPMRAHAVRQPRGSSLVYFQSD